MSQEPERKLTVREVAQFAHVDEITVYRHIDKGALRVTRIGRSIRISPADAAVYLGEDVATLLRQK